MRLYRADGTVMGSTLGWQEHEWKCTLTKHAFAESLTGSRSVESMSAATGVILFTLAGTVATVKNATGFEIK